MPVVTQSRFPYSETIDHLVQAITNGGNTLFASIDQTAAAAAAGLTLRPTTLLVFGNPKAGTALMDAFPLCALDLPLKLLVWEAGGVVNVAYVPATEIARRNGIVGKDALIGAMDKALGSLTQGVAAADRPRAEA